MWLFNNLQGPKVRRRLLKTVNLCKARSATTKIIHFRLILKGFEARSAPNPYKIRFLVGSGGRRPTEAAKNKEIVNARTGPETRSEGHPSLEG